MIQQKKAVVLIYVLFLVSVAIVFATILLNNNAFLFNITKFFDIDAKLYSNMHSDGKIMVDINREVNVNGGGFVDNISCPDWVSITMSGSTQIGYIWSTLKIINGTSDTYCEGTYNSASLKIYFNSGFTDFVSADYNGSVVSLTNGVWAGPFSDPDNTEIDFSWYTITTPDLYDDNYNSDNYRVNSTWGAGTGTFYPDSYQDDDADARRTLFGYAAPDFWFKKVFWNTPAVTKIIDENTNNDDGLNDKIWDSTTWVLYFDIDKPYEIKVYELDKTKYSDTKELYVLDVLTASGSTWDIWYLEKDGTFAGSINPSTVYTFNFQDSMYAAFLKSTSSGTLLYQITGEDRTSGNDLYITPIDDSNDSIVRYMWNEIIINDDGILLAKESEIVYKK